MAWLSRSLTVVLCAGALLAAAWLPGPALAQAAGGAPQAAGDAAPPPYTIAVLGDSLAGGIGESLIRLLGKDTRFRILRRAKPATGLTRFDLFNWQNRVEEISAGEHFDAAIVLMGTNDRQSLYLDNFRAAAFDSKEWLQVYQTRFDSFVNHLLARNVWVVWVGLPAMQSPNFDRGMKRITEIYRDLSARHCITFVPLYDLTVDERGAFAATGLDRAGRPRVLRANDGIHFTAPGYDRITQHLLDRMRRDVVGCEQPADSEVGARRGPEAAPPPDQVTAKAPRPPQ